MGITLMLADLPTGLMLSEDVTERLKVCSKLIWMVN